MSDNLGRAAATEEPAPASGWEKAGRVAGGVSTVILTIYGLAVIVIGIVLMTFGGTGILLGLGVAAYGLYLAIPGGKKWVIY